MKKIFCLLLSTLLLIGAFSVFSAAHPYSPVVDSPLNGVKVGFFGDSICAANVEKNTDYASIRGWAGRMGYVHSMDWENYGVGGASVSTIRGDNTVFAQLQGCELDKLDMIILHGGTNDAWSGALVGSMTEPDEFDESDTYETATFAGGLEQLFAYIREENPEATVGFIINFKFIAAVNGVQVQVPDGNGGTVTDYQLRHMDKYVEMTKKICDKWEVPYLDLYSDDKLTQKLHPVSGDSYSKTYIYDYVHPSSLGYDVLFPYIEKFMLELVTPEPEVTTAATTVVTDAVTTAATTSKATEAETKPGGCGAVTLSVLGATSVTVSCAVLLLRKRKKD